MSSFEKLLQHSGLDSKRVNQLHNFIITIEICLLINYINNCGTEYK